MIKFYKRIRKFWINFASISKTLMRYGAKLSNLLSYTRCTPSLQAARTNRVGNTFSFIGQAIKRDFITGELLYRARVFIPSSLFDSRLSRISQNDNSKSLNVSHDFQFMGINFARIISHNQRYYIRKILS